MIQACGLRGVYPVSPRFTRWIFISHLVQHSRSPQLDQAYRVLPTVLTLSLAQHMHTTKYDTFYFLSISFIGIRTPPTPKLPSTGTMESTTMITGAQRLRPRKRSRVSDWALSNTHTYVSCCKYLSVRSVYFGSEACEVVCRGVLQQNILTKCGRDIVRPSMFNFRLLYVRHELTRRVEIIVSPRLTSVALGPREIMRARQVRRRSNIWAKRGRKAYVLIQYNNNVCQSRPVADTPSFRRC